MMIELYHTTSDLKTRFRKEKDPRLAVRIRSVYLGLMGKTAPEIAVLLGYSRRAIQAWIQAYNRNGLEGLRDTPGRGTRCKLNPDQLQWLRHSDRIESYLPPVRHLKNIDRVARALYALEARRTESDYGAACRFLGLKNRKRSLICLMTDLLDRDASAVIIGHMARFARYHLPLAVTLADPPLRALAREPLARRGDPYAKALALDVLTARDEALASMRRHGVSVLDVEPRALTPDLINRYLLIKSAGRL